MIGAFSFRARAGDVRPHQRTHLIGGRCHRRHGAPIGGGRRRVVAAGAGVLLVGGEVGLGLALLVDLVVVRRRVLVVLRGPETLIVVSSDLSHYLPYAQAQARDRATVERILNFATDLRGVITTFNAGAEQMLGGALGRLFAVAEAYPDLKADQTMRELSEELSSTENRIGFARQAYNDHVLEFNDAAAQFPTLIVARLFNFSTQSMLESTSSEVERQPVKVAF